MSDSILIVQQSSFFSSIACHLKCKWRTDFKKIRWQSRCIFARLISIKKSSFLIMNPALYSKPPAQAYKKETYRHYSFHKPEFEFQTANQTVKLQRLSLTLPYKAVYRLNVYRAVSNDPECLLWSFFSSKCKSQNF